MKIIFQSVNFNASEELKEYTEKKLNKLDQYYDKIISAEVYMKVENISEKENKTVEVKLAIPGNQIVVKKTGRSFEESVDVSLDVLKRNIIKSKEKQDAKIE